MLRGLFTLFLAVFTVVGFNVHAEEVADKKDIVGVLFYADWCGACKILDPKVEKARNDERIEDVEFVVFDMTNTNTIKSTRATAEKENLNPLLDKYGATTGFLVVYDRGEGKVVETIKSSKSQDEIIFAFEQAAKKS